MTPVSVMARAPFATAVLVAAMVPWASSCATAPATPSMTTAASLRSCPLPCTCFDDVLVPAHGADRAYVDTAGILLGAGAGAAAGMATGFVAAFPLAGGFGGDERFVGTFYMQVAVAAGFVVGVVAGGGVGWYAADVWAEGR